MVKIKKSTPPASNQPDDSTGSTPPAPMPDGPAFRGAPFEQDRAETSSTAPTATKKTRPGATLQPPGEPSRGPGDEEGSPGSQVPAEGRRAVTRPASPDSALMETAWSDYLLGSASEEDLHLLKPHYQELATVCDGLRKDQQELRLRALQLEQAALTPKSPASRAVLLRRGKYDADLGLHRERTEECEQDTKYFAHQVLPTVATMHPRRNRIKNKILKKLNALPNLERPNRTFVSVYSRFIETHGGQSGEEDRLDKKMNGLEFQLECQNYTRYRLECTRADCAKRLNETLTIDALKQLLASVETMEEQHDTYAQNHREFTSAAREFVTKITVASNQKDGVLALTKEVNAKKPKVRQQLGRLKALAAPLNDFEQTFLDLKSLVGHQVVRESGVHTTCEMLRDLHADNRLTYHYMGRVTKAVEQEIDSADSMTALLAAEKTIQELHNNVNVFNESAAAFEAQVAIFNRAVQAVLEEHHRAGLAKRVAEAMERFTKNPTCEAPEDLTSETYRDVVKKNPPGADHRTVISTYSQLREELRSLCSSVLTIKGLEAAIADACHHGTSESKVTQMERDVLRHSALVASHNALFAGYKRQSEAFLKALSALKPAPPTLNPTATRLLAAVSRQPQPLFQVVHLGPVATDSKGEFQVPVADRVTVLKQLLQKSPGLDVNAKSRRGNNLVHVVVKNLDLQANEKIELIRCLIDLGVDLNVHDQDSRYALDTVLWAYDREPDLISFLKRSGGLLSPRKQAPVTAHFIGLDGYVSLPGKDGPLEVDLEGLTPRVAEYFVDPWVNHILTEESQKATSEIKSALQTMGHAYRDVRSHRRFIDTLRQARSAKEGARFGPVMLSTGWDVPSGHTIGFVFNQEADGAYLYACNTGDSKDPTRSVVKYQVTDFDQAIGFFKECDRDENRTRSFYTEDPTKLGFLQCETIKQLPLWINKSEQKRGNCPMASRKACLLAMLWSTTREEKVSPEKVRATYKKITTKFRILGVNQLLVHGPKELLGRALVSMLTKFDRPACQQLAHRLADAILKGSPGKPTGRRRPETDTTIAPNNPIARLKRALEITNQDLGAMTTEYGESLAVYARRKGHTETYEVLSALTD